MKAPTVAINAICWWPQQLVSRQSAILSALYYSSSPLSVPKDLTKKNCTQLPAESDLVCFSRSLVGTRRSRQKKLATENSLTDSPPAAACSHLKSVHETSSCNSSNKRSLHLSARLQALVRPLYTSNLHSSDPKRRCRERIRTFHNKKNSTPTTTTSDAHAPRPTNPAHATKKTKTRSSIFLDNTKSTTVVDFRTRMNVRVTQPPPFFSLATERTKKRNSKLNVLKSSFFQDFQ
jgi:hypothetical protein